MEYVIMFELFAEVPDNPEWTGKKLRSGRPLGIGMDPPKDPNRPYSKASMTNKARQVARAWSNEVAGDPPKANPVVREAYIQALAYAREAGRSRVNANDFRRAAGLPIVVYDSE